MLKGIFPVIVGAAFLQWLYLKYKMKKVRDFINVEPNVVLRKIHNFYWKGGEVLHEWKSGSCSSVLVSVSMSPHTLLAVLSLMKV